MSRKLAPPWRKALMVLHLVSSLGLLGVDLCVLALGVAGSPGGSLLGHYLLVPLAFTSLITGVAQGVLTPWGLFRHWWVTLKLVLMVIGTGLSLFVLTPALDSGGPEVVRDASGPCVVLLVLTVLSVYKPFGRIRRVTKVPYGTSSVANGTFKTQP
ncbi:hypothetical protein GCM10010174_13600 [Kutzneria viridogrisea]|uniref:Uncharacterized protein n=2 Tax=Kutzneria TaxID=43356 RepID=W5WIK2_9PSEU|nr:hypothetical protein [Kutzneria albida]AHI01034.1 hypothetical protein KALB_7676 [Kutzneria albida DSM 43870]MBA8926291.1 hypothetical protein [Kutzneria viridogrisea]